MYVSQELGVDDLEFVPYDTLLVVEAMSILVTVTEMMNRTAYHSMHDWQLKVEGSWPQSRLEP